MSAPASPAGVPAVRPSTLSIWVHAARPNTLPAAAAGVVVGLGAALCAGAAFRLDTAIGCLLVALLLQIVANFANDLSDFRRGADTDARQGPMRVTAAGLVTERQLEIAIAVVIGCAAVVGLYLVAVGGWVLLALGALAIVAALAYTGGPFPYGYKALGEVFVFLFFGLVAVAGTAYLQDLVLRPLYLAATLPPGALITAILVVNNLRDIPTDTVAGKRTLAVVIGKRWTQREYALLLLVAYGVPVALALDWLTGGLLRASSLTGHPYVWQGLAFLLPLLTVPLAWPLLRKVWTFGEPRELNLVLKGTARLSLWHGLLFAIGLVIAGWSMSGGAG